MEKQLDFFDRIDPKEKKEKDEQKSSDITLTPKKETRVVVEEEVPECAQCDIYGPMGCPRHRKRN